MKWRLCNFCFDWRDWRWEILWAGNPQETEYCLVFLGPLEFIFSREAP